MTNFKYKVYNEMLEPVLAQSLSVSQQTRSSVTQRHSQQRNSVSLAAA